ncbi:DUF4233 domain-containing protein [uncultured Microbacterium sp.]|uniref:DUF4233 domain-containing protein n=1 Tax=uncultured Microbacterium sp. TaxID=191216 RepID=UPI0025FD4381|nr:DUF4233 domain-containing protein [uncultured Microbacterium sp.]
MAVVSEARDASPTRRAPRPARGLTQKLGSVILGFESIVVALAGLTIYGLKALGPDVEPWWGIVGGAVVAVAMLVTAGLLGTRGGIVMGWILQVIVLLSALLVPAILLVFLVFGGMWTYAMIVGGRVDRAARRRAADTPSTPETTTESE